MKLLILLLLLVAPVVDTTNREVTFVKNWKNVFLPGISEELICLDGCAKVTPYNVSKKIDKSAKRLNESEKDAIPEKSIDNFDEWTKKRRDAAVANQINDPPPSGSPVRHEELKMPSLPPLARPTRNFASRECGAKVIAANPEAENAKAVVNEKDVDDYMRNPCQSAKDKFIVVELCEAIQIKKFAIGNFELFASRPKTIHVFISERYPPLANWISLGSFHLEDHHKRLQTFEVPATNVYAKYVRINLEDHYGKEHYCIVSVVNVMGSTLADEYDNEEAAAQLLNVIEKTEEQPVTTPPPSEQKMQTQLPVPPRSPMNLNQRVAGRQKGFDFRKLNSTCRQCPVDRVSHLICHLLPRNSQNPKRPIPPSTVIPTTQKPAVSENQSLKTEFGMWAERSRHLNFEQSRRRNLAEIQRTLPKPATKVPPPKIEEPSTPPPPPPASETSKPPKTEPILPAPGGSTSQREMVLMKLSKRISAVEMNLTLSSEYLSELSKQYVSQMSVYQQELKETRKTSKASAQAIEIVMRTKLNGVKRELRDLRQSVHLLQQLEHRRYQNSQNEMSQRNVFMSSCHISNVPPHPTLPRLPLVIPPIHRNFENLTNFEERMKKFYETAKSVMFGSVTWNTDHLIVALISFNIMALSFLFAGVFYIHRRNKERCEETQSSMKSEIRARIAKVGVENRKMISKGMRRAELAVTAAVSSALKIDRSTSDRKAMTELETALANLFSAQQNRIEEQFEQNQKLLRDVIAEGRRSRADDTLSVEDSESASETEQSKEETPVLE